MYHKCPVVHISLLLSKIYHRNLITEYIAISFENNLEIIIKKKYFRDIQITFNQIFYP